MIWQIMMKKLVRQLQLENINPIPLDYMICQVMSGNGAMTGLTKNIMRIVLIEILVDQLKENTVCCAGARGTTTTTTAPGTTTTVEPTECDCEAIYRSPDDDQIPAGSNLGLMIEDSCELYYSEVQWYWSEGESGTPQTSNFSNRSPASDAEGAAINHSVQFSVPSTATGTICVWARTQGADDPDCRDCFTIAEVPEEPAFVAVKTSTMECINDDTAARITYTIHVRNISDVEGVIESVQDTYDSRFQSSWVSNITPPPDSHSGNVIVWNNNGAGYTLAANDGASGGDDELEFSYVVTVPSEYFGEEYRNHAIVQPEDQEAIHLETLVEIICLVPTGILDHAIVASVVALIFVIIGLISVRYQDTLVAVVGKRIGGLKVPRFLEGFKYTKKERFERRTVRGIEKKRRDK